MFTMSREHTTKDPNENKDFYRPRLPDDQKPHELWSKELHHQRSVRQKHLQKRIGIPERSQTAGTSLSNK